jgi:diaminopimelate decarboxylase
VNSISAIGGEVVGLHVYLGTNILNCDMMLRTLCSFFALARTVPTLQYVNIGGGVGIDYGRSGTSFPLTRFGNNLDLLMTDLSAVLKRGIALYFEPGRGLVANVGSFLVSVTDVKCLSGKQYICVDGSIAQFPRPLHHPETPHQVRALGSEQTSSLKDVVVVGRTTFSRDVLAPRAQLPESLSVGDLLAFEDAGAYCASMASQFLGQPEPSGVIV